METIIITPGATFKEFAHSVTASLNSPTIRIPIQIASLFLGLGMVLTLIETWGSFAGIFPMIAAISMVALSVFSRMATNSRLKTCYLAGKNDVATYSFSENGVTGACKCTKTELSWGAFDRVLETETMYVLITKALGYLRIPKRDIPPGRAHELTSLMREKIGDPIRTH